jgi:hypothetical protein
VEAPDVERDGEAEVEDRDEDRGPELLEQHSHHSGLRGIWLIGRQHWPVFISLKNFLLRFVLHLRKENVHHSGLQ